MSRKERLLVLGAIIVITAVVFSRSIENGFTNWDDNGYVTENLLIRDLSVNGLTAIFTTFYEGNYHPLTALTNALEYKFFVLDPRPYHITNVLLHLANVALVFYLVFLLTDRIEASAIVALFFGIHPMHVESVAWISERKDVLYTLFYLGSLISYVCYLKHGRRRVYLVTALALFFLSLLSKSAAVITPLVLVLIDYYHGRKLEFRVILEKMPFFVLSLVFGIVALYSQASATALNGLSAFPVLDRILISCYAAVFYVIKLIWPFNLSAFYSPPSLDVPLPPQYYLAPVAMALIVIGVLRAGVLKKELRFGLSFYLVNIILVLQVLSVGKTIVSDRYSYASYIGLFFIGGTAYCAMKDGSLRLRFVRRSFVGLCIAGFAAVCAVSTWERVKVWRDSITLFSDAINKDATTQTPYYNRGTARFYAGDLAGAISDLSEALRIRPHDVDCRMNRGVAEMVIGDHKSALADFETILMSHPNNADALVNCGRTKAILGDYEGALKQFNRAIEINPNHKVAYYNRGQWYYRMKEVAKACEDWKRAAEFGYPDAYRLVNEYCQ